jgi:hypothetical protein
LVLVTPSLTDDQIMSFKVDRLQDELNRRGRGINGDKGMLQHRLKICVEDGVPVSATPVSRHGSMTGLGIQR